MKRILTLLFFGIVYLTTCEVIAQEMPKSRLTIGGYGEITMSRHFYAEEFQRLIKPEQYAGDKGYGRFDIPHAVFFIGYDFGRGWSFASEIEFEHGGVEAAIELEEEETGEYEKEIERGGEVALEQFWIQKSWNKSVNLRMGNIIIPVGFTNQYHLPTEYFGVFRPEGEATIMPSTWREPGISLWGVIKDWRYEVLFIAGLDADRFNREGWISGGAGSPYEFKIANSYAGAFRVDNRSVKGLRLGLSGYYGHSAQNSLKTAGYNNLKGAVIIGSFDFTYDDYNLIIRGNADYGNLSDSEKISLANSNLAISSFGGVAESAVSYACELGYDMFSPFSKLSNKDQKLYLFGRYEYYDSMHTIQGSITDWDYYARNCYSVGLNYFPIKDIVIKAEYQSRQMSGFNTENTFSIGFCYAGLFNR